MNLLLHFGDTTKANQSQPLLLVIGELFGTIVIITRRKKWKCNGSSFLELTALFNFSG